MRATRSMWPNRRRAGWSAGSTSRSHLIESDSRAEINALVVEEGHRSRGTGRILMQHAEQWARARGCSAVVLRSNVIRARAHAFYEKLGYQTLKTQKYFRKNL